MNLQELFKGSDGVHYGKIKKGRRVTPSSIESLIVRASIYEVAQKLGFKITKKNKSILCFAHRERTPSCNIVDEKSMFFCKGCGNKGNVMHLVMQVKGINQIQAAKWLQKNLAYEKLEFEEMVESVELKVGDINDYLMYENLLLGENNINDSVISTINEVRYLLDLKESIPITSYKMEQESLENFYNSHYFELSDAPEMIDEDLRDIKSGKNFDDIISDT